MHKVTATSKLYFAKFWLVVFSF